MLAAASMRLGTCSAIRKIALPEKSLALGYRKSHARCSFYAAVKSIVRSASFSMRVTVFAVTIPLG